LTLDVKAYDEWLAKGARPTATVAFLAEVVRSGKGFPEKKKTVSRKVKAKLAATQEAEKVEVAKEKPAQQTTEKVEPAVVAEKTTKSESKK
jgi:polyhydroxyalkanoate synthesis regulator phasin